MNIDAWKGTWVLQTRASGDLNYWSEDGPACADLKLAKHFTTKSAALEAVRRLPASEKWEVHIGHAA